MIAMFYAWSTDVNKSNGMTKPKNLVHAFELAENVTTRKQARKLLKRTKKLLKKDALLKERTQESLPQREANSSGERE